MSTFIPPFAVQSGEGRALETPTGDSVTVKADTRKTNGSLAVVELLIGPKQGPALHTHLREDELWYVIEGDFRFKAGDAMLRVSNGRHGLRAAWHAALLPEHRRRAGAVAGDHHAIGAGTVLRAVRRAAARPGGSGKARRRRARQLGRVCRSTGGSFRPALGHRAAARADRRWAVPQFDQGRGGPLPGRPGRVPGRLNALMRQPLAAETTQRADRSARRRFARAGQPALEMAALGDHAGALAEYQDVLAAWLEVSGPTPHMRPFFAHDHVRAAGRPDQEPAHPRRAADKHPGFRPGATGPAHAVQRPSVRHLPAGTPQPSARRAGVGSDVDRVSQWPP